MHLVGVRRAPMAKQFDYYAGYPNQQKTPKWVGVAIGSVFGCLTLMMLAVGIRVVMPARIAEASKATEADRLSSEGHLAAPSLMIDESAVTVSAAEDTSAPLAKAHRASRHQLKA